MTGAERPPIIAAHSDPRRKALPRQTGRGKAESLPAH